jgi:hypothetical protein
LSFDLNGDATVGALDSFDFNEASGTLVAFNHATHTLIRAVSLSGVRLTRFTGGDFRLEGGGTASVDGQDTDILFIVSRTGGAARFELWDAETGASLASGTSEVGGATVELSGASQ